MLSRILTREFWISLDFRLAARFGAPKHHTISGYVRHLELQGHVKAGQWRKRIDGLFLMWKLQENHCQKAYVRETVKIVSAAS